MPVKKKKKIKQKDDLKTYYQYDTNEYKQKQKILWFGVIFLTSMVFFMWFLVTNATFFDTNKNLKKSQEAQLLNESTQKITEIIQNAKY